MYRYAITLFCIINILVSQDMTGYDLAKKIDQKEQPKSSKSNITMDLINLKNDKQKTKEMISLSKDDGSKMLLFFKTPKRDKGVGFLKIESDEMDKISLFIPKLKKIRRISSSGQSDSFMGSDLSFEDMLSRNLDDFKYTLIETTEDMYILESICKDTESAYSRHLSWVSKDQLLITKEESYDKNNKLLKEKLFEHVKISDYYIISTIDVTSIQDQHRTILSINTLEVDGDISDDIFQEISLKRFKKFLK